MPKRFPIPLFLAGCHAREIRDHAVVTSIGGDILAASPAEGAQGVHGPVAVQVALGALAEGRLPKIKVIGADDRWTPECSLDSSGTLVSCDPFEGLRADEPYDLEVTVPGTDAVVVDFMSGLSDEGRAFMLTPDARVVRLGHGADTATKADELVSGTKMLGALIGTGASRSFLVGPASDDGDVTRVDAPGFTFAVPVEVLEDGSFESPPMNLFLPLGSVQTLMTDCTVRGLIRDDRIEDFSLGGVIPASSLVALTDPLGVLGTYALSQVDLDMDLNADDEPDGASFILRGDVPEVALGAWTR